MVSIIQYISILIELLITGLGILIVSQKKKMYGLGISLTFAIYFFYDLVKFTGLNVHPSILYLLFFIATLSALWAVWGIYQEKTIVNKKRGKKR